jgi:hypothetical protein
MLPDMAKDPADAEPSITCPVVTCKRYARVLDTYLEHCQAFLAMD